MRTPCAAIVTTALIGLIAVAADPRPETPNQQLLKTDLLVVTAHPDDESMMAATMARYADEGKVVALVTCTRGEGGGNGTGKESGAALGAVREAELRKCLGILGVRHLYFLDQLDWAYTESVRATLAKWGHDESLRRLVRLVRLLRPEVVCTMDPAPVGGQHGHHQAAGRLATEVFEAAADPTAFPELSRNEGLSPWRVRKLYWSSWGPNATVRIDTGGQARGALAAGQAGKTYVDIANEAERNHRSQGFDKFLSMLAKAPAARQRSRSNGFLLVKSRVRTDPKAEKDLFDGIAGAKPDGPDAQHDILASQFPKTVATAAVVAQIRPRANVIDYREWLKANGISRLMTRLPAHVTVVQGQNGNQIDVDVTNFTDESRTGSVSLRVPDGWALNRNELSYAIPARGTGAVSFLCSVPPDAAVKSYELTARVGEAADVGQADVVPALRVKRLHAGLPVDADVAKWREAGFTPVPIPHTNAFQRAVPSPEECSGQFFVGYDDKGVQTLVDVTDDTVVRNIEADDIKAHWRSTSVEICIDPAPRSENTFTTLKLGIFPEDTTGKVRAARDADANPGEIGRIHSQIRLASRVDPTGYAVEAHIPWAEVFPKRPNSSPAGTPLGFNIIIYHAGRKDARPGEDVGKSRLAWSFWPGVPGRPEVWGLATLE